MEKGDCVFVDPNDMGPPDPKAQFTCSSCGKIFSRNSNLKAHERLHTGEMPYVCSFDDCRKSFKWKSSLSSHLKTHGKGTTPSQPRPAPEKQRPVAQSENLAAIGNRRSAAAVDKEGTSSTITSDRETKHSKSTSSA